LKLKRDQKRALARISLYDGVIDTLSVLKNKTKMILITNAHRKTLNIKLEKYNLTPYFDEMVCAHELHYVKEDIQLWYMLRSKYRLDYEKTLLVEDTINNINVGLSAGISGAIYVGDEKFTVSDKIIKLSSINQILSAVNYR
jgi:putative hydrolase of the HAD superfamily